MDEHQNQSRITQYGDSALNNLANEIRTSEEGSRNNTLYRCAIAAGQLEAAGALVGSQAVAALKQAATQVGLTETEVLTTIKNGFELGQKKPRDLSRINQHSIRALASKGDKPNSPEQPMLTSKPTPDYVLRMLKRCAPIVGTPAEHYLLTRNIALTHTADDFADLQYHKDLAYRDADGQVVGYFNCMIATARNMDGKVTGLHRTYLKDDGTGKADVPSPKKMLGAITGSKLSIGQDLNNDHVGLSEGVETGLSYWTVEPIPLDVALSSAGFSSYTPADHIQRVSILSDNDRAGQKAAHKLAKRLQDLGLSVRIIAPPTPFNDLNDYLQKEGIETVKALIDGTPWLPTEDLLPKQERLFLDTIVGQVQFRNVKWFWSPKIALGKITLLCGEPGQGKSQGTTYFAARATTGTPFIDGQPCEKGSVIMIACEDDVVDTIGPRLQAAGADLNKVHILDAVRQREDNRLSKFHPFNLTTGIQGLADMIDNIGDVSLVVIDPISAYLGGADSHNNAAVREMLVPLQNLASEKSVAIVLITHLNKSTGMSPMSRVNGSGAFVAVSRAAFLIGSDPASKERRVMVPLKNNLGPEGDGIAFTIEPCLVEDDIKTSRIVMDPTPVQISPEDVLDGNSNSAPTGPSAKDDAEAWLRDELKGGPAPANEIFARAKVEGIAARTLRRAKREMNSEIRVKRKGFGKDGVSMWSLAEPTDA